MKARYLFPVLLTVAVLGGLPATASHAQGVRPLSAAILDFREADPELEGTGAAVSALLQVRLGVDSEAILVERADLDEIFSEHELVLSEAVTPGQAAKVAQLTGAEVLISGRIFTVQDRTHLVAKVISTSSGRVFGATAAYDRGGQMDAAVSELSKSVAEILSRKTAELRGGQSLEEVVLEQLRSKVEGQPTAKVYVFVTEAILQAPAPDPAAQVEISRMLEKVGWQVVETEQEADFSIKGEAFAEIGVRRGNLWFTRSRLEFSVRSANGEVLKTDRVVCGNVDLTQAVSAKGALQKSGLLAVTLAADAWLTRND